MTGIFNAKVYKELSTTHRVLVSEWVDGVKLSAVEPCLRAGDRHSRCPRSVLFTQLLQVGFVHAGTHSEINVFHHFVIDHSDGDNIFLPSH